MKALFSTQRTSRQLFLLVLLIAIGSLLSSLFGLGLFQLICGTSTGMEQHPDMMRLFSKDPQVISLGATVLRMVALSEPFYGISIIMEGMLQGMGKTMLPFINNLLGMWGIRILGTFVCIHFLGLGLVAAWGCMIAHNLLLGALLLTRYLRGNWNPLKREMNPGQEVSRGI